jgi:hypothetical protein
MTCAEARSALSRAIDGGGDEATARHVEACPACAAELAALRAVDRALVASVDGAPPPGLLDGFARRVQAKIAAEEARPELEDLRALAASALVRAAESERAGGEASALYTSSGALGQVVLPVPDAAPRRSRWPALVGGLVGLAAMVGIAVMVTRDERSESPPPPAPAPESASASASAPVTAPASAPVPAPAPAPETVAVPPKPRPVREAPRAEAAPVAPAPPPPPAVKSAEQILEEIAEPVPAPAEEKRAGDEKLSHEDIKRGMDGITAAVQACHDDHGQAGQVFLKVRISPDGTVVEAVATDKFAGTATGRCVEAAVRRARFEAFDGPPMSVRYSFRLEEIE